MAHFPERKSTKFFRVLMNVVHKVLPRLYISKHEWALAEDITMDLELDKAQKMADITEADDYRLACELNDAPLVRQHCLV